MHTLSFSRRLLALPVLACLTSMTSLCAHAQQNKPVSSPVYPVATRVAQQPGAYPGVRR